MRFIELTLAGTGIRLGEALALQWADLDLTSRKIRVERAFSDGALNTPKSWHGRTVDISKPLADVLLEWKTKAGKGKGDRAPWVFASEAGTLLDGANVRKIMTRDLEEGEPSTSLNAPLFTTYLCQLDVAAR